MDEATRAKMHTIVKALQAKLAAVEQAAQAAKMRHEAAQQRSFADALTVVQLPSPRTPQEFAECYLRLLVEGISWHGCDDPSVRSIMSYGAPKDRRPH